MCWQYVNEDEIINFSGQENIYLSIYFSSLLQDALLLLKRFYVNVLKSEKCQMFSCHPLVHPTYTVSQSINVKTWPGRFCLTLAYEQNAIDIFN